MANHRYFTDHGVCPAAADVTSCGPLPFRGTCCTLTYHFLYLNGLLRKKSLYDFPDHRPLPPVLQRSYNFRRRCLMIGKFRYHFVDEGNPHQSAGSNASRQSHLVFLFQTLDRSTQGNASRYCSGPYGVWIIGQTPSLSLSLERPYGKCGQPHRSSGFETYHTGLPRLGWGHRDGRGCTPA